MSAACLGCIRKLPTHPDSGSFYAALRHFPLKYVSIPAKKSLAQRKNSSLPVTLGVGRIHPRTSKREKSRDLERCDEKAGQSRGVGRAPRRSQLPAVRAVSGIYEGVPNTAKNSRRALRNEKSPPFQGKRRGCTKKVHGKRKKQQVQRWAKQLRVYREKQLASSKTCKLPSKKTTLYCTRYPDKIKLTIICQKSCSSAL